MTLPIAMKNYSLLPLLKILAAALLLAMFAGTSFALPEIEVDKTTPAPVVALTNNSGTTDFGSVPIGSSATRTFTIRNTTVATVPVVTADNLTGLTISKATGHTADYSFTDPVTIPLNAGSSTTFTVTFTPTATGTRSTEIHIASNDGDENPFVINLTGTGQAPAIKVESPVGTPITPGMTGGADFGAITVNKVGNLTFTVTNTGNADLNLTNVSLVAGTAPVFAIKSDLTSTTVAPDGTAEFTLQFAPTSAGTFTGSVSIPTNVTGKNPYVIPFTAKGLDPIVNKDEFGYTMDTAAPATESSYLKNTDPDVFIPGALLIDDAALLADIGFSFKFYEKAYTKCYISTNGLISFDAGVVAWSPTPIPNTSSPDNYIAPFWSDLKPGPGAGQILYATRGTSPNRTFIVKWDDIPEYYVSTRKVTFQLTLRENSNSIEVQYKSITAGFGDNRTFAGMGIESGNYGSTPQSPAANVIGLKAGHGLVDKDNKAIDGKPIKSFPYAIRYTRPVVYSVESEYQQPTASNPAVTKSVGTPLTDPSDVSIFPTVKTHYNTPIGTNQRFEAPEFIYLNKKFEKLASVGDVDDPDPDKIAWYRLVNDGYAIDGQVVQGTHTFFSTTLDHDVAVVWRWRLEHAVIIKSATGSGGFGNPSPEVGRQWYKAGDQFTASIDTSVVDSDGGSRFYTTGYTLQDKNGVSVGTTTSFASDGSTRRTTSPISVTQPLKLEWQFTGQVRYRFDATSSAPGGGLVNGQSFVQVDQDSPVYGAGSNTEVWIEKGRKVVVGAFYRSKDRAITLGDFGTAPGADLVGFGQSVVALKDVSFPDLEGKSRVARVYTVTAATAATEIHWSYLPTIFRAKVELGNSLDGQIPNVQLVPDLPDDAVLNVTGSGSGNLIITRTPPPEGSITGLGDPLRWDRLGKRLFPVRPGSFEITWPAGINAGKSYKIEILAGYPKDTGTWTPAIEDDDGARVKTGLVSLTSCSTTKDSTSVACGPTVGLEQGMVVDGPNIVTGTTITSILPSGFVLSAAAKGNGAGLTLTAWKYSYSVTFPEIDPNAGFPAQKENAHYRHLFDPDPARQAPTKLDLSATDEWKFLDLTYADGSTKAAVNSTAPGVPFTTKKDGRSVLLFSYRPNPDEIADGSLDRENLAVRIVQSSPVNLISRDDPKLVLGRHALVLGSGSTPGGACGVIQTGGAPAISSLDPGNKFVVDFWLNAKGLKSPAAVTLTNGVTISGSTTLTCASTASVVPGMGISGKNIPAGTKIVSTSGTTLVLSNAATANGTGLSLSATNKPVTVVTAGGGGFKVTLDPEASTATATYRGIQVSHPLPKSGAAWRHYAVHVFTSTFFKVNVTVVDFYLDGVRQEQAFVTGWLPALAGTAVSGDLTDSSLKFGVDAETRSGLQLDNFRIFNLGSDPLGYLNPGEVIRLRSERDMTTAEKKWRSVNPLVSLDFESAPTSGWFANQGTLANVGVGKVSGTGTYPGIWANVDLQEVATRVESTLDNAGFGGSGYLLNAVSNYNSNLYTRSAEIGTWGPIFPVNHSVLFKASTGKLEVAYYENPYLTDRLSNPNVAWPYVATEYNDVVYPVLGPNKDKAIYIASRIGSEGVDTKGNPQTVFDLASYSDFQIYNQPLASAPGYNPNEEHALVAPSGRAALKVKNLGEDSANNPPLAAFALQNAVNTAGSSYSSDPWVLVQARNLKTGEPEMAAYQVFKTRTGTGTIAFPRPADTEVAATPGLAYESASKPEDRFLTLDPAKSYNFEYKFEYPVLAGDLLIPPYPLNMVIGNVSMSDARGGNIILNGVSQRTLWRDVNNNAWIVSGGGSFFHQFFYPFRGDFYLPAAPAIGTPVAWLPTVAGFTGTGSSLEPVKVVYNSKWRTDYPKLKRGETLTYQGGEYFNENPGAKGLPALVAMKAAEVIYDSSTPSMLMNTADTVNANGFPLSKSSARIIRPLDRREISFTTAKMMTAGFSPAETTKVFSVAERWYFKELPGSLAKRFYFDSLAEKLVFRGYLNDKDSGNPDLTTGPDPVNILEPNVMTLDEYVLLRGRSKDREWETAVDNIFKLSQNPGAISSLTASLTTPVYLQGVKTAPPSVSTTFQYEFRSFWSFLSGLFQRTVVTPQLAHADSFGVGSALVPSSGLLIENPTGSLYVTIAENNRSELGGAPVSLHIVEIIPDRFRGAIKVIEPADAFSEKITLQHNGEFGANTGDLYYEWWIRDAGPLDVVAQEVLANGTLSETDASGNSLWQEYIPRNRALLADPVAQHLGSHTVVLEGRPDVVLADKLVLMRYRHKSESNWKLVPFEFAKASTAWKPGNIAPTSPAPFQWAGAANSPQLQADGSKRYIPQLVMGWVKRVLDRINPYEARYADFFSNETPATYSSQIQIAGAPYAGKVALNPDKNVIERTGLIELYQTVLARARELSIDNSSNGNSTDGINQALLLAATRLSTLYELLGNEAYSDAQDSTINAGEDSSLAGVASYTHAFQNMESDLQHEELALLRGTDFLKSYPVYNRMFWNYAKGLGEAAYNVNYNIYDANSDGFINEDDARKLYPQGHGDAWGHYLSAINMPYTLLQHPGFTWRTRSELYSLMQNVLEVDYLDEKTFARLAASKARAGRDIVRESYRLGYTQNPDGQWQGYTDGADPARAWGVSEWAHRGGQGAWFDWAVANAMLPAEAAAATPVATPENLDRIDRLGTIDQIGEIAGGLHEIQNAMDEANGGVNPLGFDSDALAFDIEFQFYTNASGGDRRSHFEQTLVRAVDAGANAVVTLDLATQSQNKLRALADDTDGLIQEAMSQDLDYRNRLIEIFGRPYTGQIGFGKAYPEGYQGPDTLLYAYLDKTKISQIVPPITGISDATSVVTYKILFDKAKGSEIMNNPVMINLYDNANSIGGSSALTHAFETLLKDSSLYRMGTDLNDLSLPYQTASRYGFQAPTEWGQRTSYGRVQGALQDMLSDEIQLDSDIADYIGFLKDVENKVHRLQSEVELYGEKGTIKDAITGVRAGFTAAFTAGKVVINALAATEKTAEEAEDAGIEWVDNPLWVGLLSVSAPVAPLKGAVATAAAPVKILSDTGRDLAESVLEVLNLVRDEVIARLERDVGELDQIGELNGMVEELENLTGAERPKRDAIGAALQSLEVHRQEYFTAQAEGFRLLKEREAFNKILASKVQKNRYQDMVFRLSRNEAMGKYQSSFNAAARFAWLAARAYDYETSLDPGSPAAPGVLLDKIVKERQLGSWVDGQPQIAHGGLAEILAQLKGNFEVLKGQLGINNPQDETEKISLRRELFRICSLDPDLAAADELRTQVNDLDIPKSQLTFDQRLLLETLNAKDDDPDKQAAKQAAIDDAIEQAPASDERWKDALKARIVPDLNKLPEFVRHCRPFATGVQPGIVIRFATCIEPGKNFFGHELVVDDHHYSTANFATKIQGLGVWMDNYYDAGLATSPRAYLVPIGNDYLRTSTSTQPITRAWNVVEQRIPTPFLINPSNLSSPGYIPMLDGVDGIFGDLRRHGDFRMYHDNGDPEADDSELVMNSRLIGRSVWNSQWMLVIPGKSLSADPEAGLRQLADTITDIKLYFLTYSHQGQ